MANSDEDILKQLEALAGRGAAMDLFESEVKRLNARVQELLESSTRYLQRARDAEFELKRIEELRTRMVSEYQPEKTQAEIKAEIAERRKDTTMERIRKRFGVV